MNKAWWKEAVVYQIYPRSFMDSNGDGIGDIQGIISKIDYIRDLGIDIIWISPIYTSPNDDNGYDISDYKGIMEEFGTMADFDQLLEEVHDRGMRLIMDLVINHTSDEHPWFIESRSSKANPYRDYYIWHPGRNGEEPNNWASIFEGPAWEYDDQTGEYYMHLFSRKQPDLNWENPDVRSELYDTINWWLDKGIDGFRVDAIAHIKKVPGLPDVPNPENKTYVPSYEGHLNRDGIHEYLQELKENTFDHYDIMTVGEADGVSVDQTGEWVGEEKGKFSMIFQFEHLDLYERDPSKGLDIHGLKQILTKWQNGLDGIGWNALFLENHDRPRSVSTMGDEGQYHKESAKSLATMYFLMQGTPYIYQGQEIGMTNVRFESIEDYNDVAIKNKYQKERREGIPHQAIMETIWQTGRDNSRTPMQWRPHSNGGFTSGIPWMKINKNYQSINVESSINDPHSIYHYYKKLIELRKSFETLIYGSYELIMEEDNRIFAYTRTLDHNMFLIVSNLFAEEAVVALPEILIGKQAELKLSNYDGESGALEKNMVFKPFEARVYKI